MKKLLSILLVLLSCCYITLPAFAAEGDLSEPSIEIICDSDTVVIGKTLQLTYSVKNAENVSDVDWITSQSNIATINKSGVVKGNDIGRTIISVVAIADGKYVSAEKEICVIRKSRVVYNLLTKKNLLSYKYSYKDDYFYTDQYKAWQMNFGYSQLYDIVAPYILLEYDYVRIYFEYENSDWMVQLWKGQYGLLFYGCEAGIYKKDHSEKGDNLLTFYSCPKDQKDWVKMQTTMYHQENNILKREFSTPYEDTWWSTGFVRGRLKQQEPANELKQVGKITFNDEEMAYLFTEGLIKCRFGQVETMEELKSDTFYLEGNTVYYQWQNISEAETTMGIKRVVATAATINFLTVVLGSMALILMVVGLMGLGFLIFLI